MNLQDLEEQLARHDANAKEYGLLDSHAIALVITRKKPPTGYKIMTPFGRCEILNCKEKDGMVQTVFAVSRKQLVMTIAKMRKELAA